MRRYCEEMVIFHLTILAIIGNNGNDNDNETRHAFTSHKVFSQYLLIFSTQRAFLLWKTGTHSKPVSGSLFNLNCLGLAI